jgi:heat shock protein HslJ
VKQLVATVIMAAVVVAACGADKGGLTDRSWRLTALNGVATDVEAGINFGADGRFTVQGGCNSGGGSWRLDGSRLTLGSIALTEMACDGSKGVIEDVFVAVLKSAPTIAKLDTRSGDLTLDGSGAKLDFTTQ